MAWLLLSPPPSTVGLSVCRVRHDLNCASSGFYGNAHELLLTLCLPTIYSSVAVLHAYLQMFIQAQNIHWKKYSRALPDYSIGLFSTLPAQFAVFGHSFIELTPYTWLTPSSSPATITQPCQEVPVLSAQAVPGERGKALNSFHVRWCDVCALRLFGERRVPHPLHAPLST